MRPMVWPAADDLLQDFRISKSRDADRKEKCRRVGNFNPPAILYASHTRVWFRVLRGTQAISRNVSSTNFLVSRRENSRMCLKLFETNPGPARVSSFNERARSQAALRIGARGPGRAPRAAGGDGGRHAGRQRLLVRRVGLPTMLCRERTQENERKPRLQRSNLRNEHVLVPRVSPLLGVDFCLRRPE